MKNLKQKLFVVCTAYLTLGFFLPQLLRFRFVLIILAVLLIGLLIDYGARQVAAIVSALLTIILLFLKILPAPFQFLYERGTLLSLSIVATVLALLLYLAAAICLSQIIAIPFARRKKTK